ncbi:MAG: DNA polymerase III subunit beta, partial [Alphaproteobacteria bacterium]
MKLTIERAALLRSLAHVQNVVERRNAIPILSNVLIEAKDGRLHLATTDMDIAIVDSSEAAVKQEGSTTAPVHTLYDIVRKLPEGAQAELSLNNDGSLLQLRAGRSNFSLSCLPKEDFPVIAEGALPHEFQLAAEDLRTLIDCTRFAISTEETRYYLNGIYCHAASADGVKVLRAVATDGHRLARLQMPLPEGAANMPGVIVPRKAVGELRKLLDETAETVTIALSDTKIRFSFESVVLSSKLIDGTFPDYDRVIPQNNDKILEVDTKLLSEAVDRVSTISTEKSRAVKLMLGKGSLSLQATSPDAGSASEELEVGYTAAPIEIGFNSRYLLDIAQQIEGGSMQFVFA